MNLALLLIKTRLGRGGRINPPYWGCFLLGHLYRVHFIFSCSNVLSKSLFCLLLFSIFFPRCILQIFCLFEIIHYVFQFIIAQLHYVITGYFWFLILSYEIYRWPRINCTGISVLCNIQNLVQSTQNRLSIAVHQNTDRNNIESISFQWNVSCVPF